MEWGRRSGEWPSNWVVIPSDGRNRVVKVGGKMKWWRFIANGSGCP